MRFRNLLAMLLIVLLLAGLIGCGAAASTLDRAEDAIDDGLDAAEDRLEYAVSQAMAPAPTAVPPAAPTQAPDAPTEAARITKEEAETIALEHVDLKADQVTRLRTEFEIDDGVPQYDVQFYRDGWEYEFEIHAETGAIISYDRDWD